MLLILDRQHGSKGGDWHGGAGVDLDGDGEITIHEREAALTPWIALGAIDYCDEQGVEVELIADGPYYERHARATNLAREHSGKVAYVALHLNAGGGGYSATFYDHRSAAGKGLATEIAAALAGLRLDGVTEHLRRPATSGGWTSRAYGCIEGIYTGPSNISAALIEPLFMDNDDHHQHLTGVTLQEIGAAVAKAAIRWGQNG